MPITPKRVGYQTITKYKKSLNILYRIRKGHTKLNRWQPYWKMEIF